MTTETKTAMQVAIEEAVAHAKAKTAKKKAKAQPPVADAAPVTAIPAVPVPAAGATDAAPVSWDPRVDRALELKTAIKAAEKELKPLEVVLRELVKAGEVHGEKGIARMASGLVKGVEQHWFTIVSKPETK